jgi:hypothetical protein
VTLSAVNIVTILSCLCSLAAAAMLMTRVPWRTGFLCLMVGLMPLTHVVILLRDRLGMPMTVPRPVADMGELIVSGLFLIAVLILRIDNAERVSTAVRLRLVEAELPDPAAPFPGQQVQPQSRLTQLHLAFEDLRLGERAAHKLS